MFISVAQIVVSFKVCVNYNHCSVDVFQIIVHKTIHSQIFGIQHTHGIKDLGTRQALVIAYLHQHQDNKCLQSS